MGSGRVAVRDALGDALMRPGGVVMLLVLGQDPAQMPLAENQDSVQELPAQRADEALAGCVHPGRLDGRAPGYISLGFADPRRITPTPSTGFAAAEGPQRAPVEAAMPPEGTTRI